MDNKITLRFDEVTVQCSLPSNTVIVFYVGSLVLPHRKVVGQQLIICSVVSLIHVDFL